MLANTVVNNFLELRLNAKISKSEKSLEYLSEKLSEAKTKMDKAKNNAEVFALEQNILSNQEFATQSRRLKEFRSSIEKLNKNYNELNNYLKLIQSKQIKPNKYEITIKKLIDLAPELNQIDAF